MQSVLEHICGYYKLVGMIIDHLDLISNFAQPTSKVDHKIANILHQLEEAKPTCIWLCLLNDYTKYA